MLMKSNHNLHDCTIKNNKSEFITDIRINNISNMQIRIETLNKMPYLIILTY